MDPSCLQSRNHDVVMFSPPVGESLARAAGLPFVPFAEREFSPDKLGEIVGAVSRLKGEEGLQFTVNAVAARLDRNTLSMLDHIKQFDILISGAWEAAQQLFIRLPKITQETARLKQSALEELDKFRDLAQGQRTFEYGDNLKRLESRSAEKITYLVDTTLQAFAEVLRYIALGRGPSAEIEAGITKLNSLFIKDPTLNISQRVQY